MGDRHRVKLLKLIARAIGDCVTLLIARPAVPVRWVEDILSSEESVKPNALEDYSMSQNQIVLQRVRV